MVTGAPVQTSDTPNDPMLSTTDAAKHFGVVSRHARLRAEEYKVRHPDQEYPQKVGWGWVAPLSAWAKVLEPKNPNMGRPRSSAS